MKEPRSRKEVAIAIYQCLTYLASEALRAGLIDAMAKITAVAHDINQMAKDHE
jgi:hypothetical protein